MNGINSSLMLIGRIMMALIFFFAGAGKFMHPHTVAAFMTMKGFPLVHFFLYAAAVTEILGALFLIFGFKARITALALFLFLIPTTLIFHDFWKAPPEEVQVQLMNFLKNVGLMGGLIYILSKGAGRFSLDYFWSESS